MRIGIIGAGMAGLSCAAALDRHGHAVTAFDKGRGPGGRMSTRRVSTSHEMSTRRASTGAGEASFDHGAQYFTARDPAFIAQIDAWYAAGVAARWPAAGDGAWVGTPAMNSPVRAMASGRDVRWGTRVTRLERPDAGGWLLHSDAGAPEAFDAMVVAVPAEQVGELIALHQPAFAAQARATQSQPCWTMMAAFSAPVPIAADCLRDRGIIGWAARNSAKPGRSGPEAWVVQASPSWSAHHLEDDAAAVADALLAALAGAAATGQPLPATISLSAHRWRYARSAALGTPMLWDNGLRLGLCGDWLLGPRVESAWLSGMHLAGAITAGAGAF